MSRERIVVNIHYGQEEFRKLFEELVRATVANQELPYKSKDETCYNSDITQSPSLWTSEVTK
jgi:hypothetical protein